MQYLNRGQCELHSGGWTLEQIARAAGVTKQAAAKWKAGRTVPTAPYIARLDMVLGISADHWRKLPYPSDGHRLADLDGLPVPSPLTEADIEEFEAEIGLPRHAWGDAAGTENVHSKPGTSESTFNAYHIGSGEWLVGYPASARGVDPRDDGDGPAPYPPH